jgi:FtsP/CotA-like multicopper oxidase with cupredoxin domain
MFGFYLLFDDVDTGNENDTSPTALRLPSGIGQFDIPLAIHDRQFKANGTTYFDQFNNDGFLGDKICINGKIQPFMKVQKRKYRFRLLDASLSRFYDLVFVDGRNNMNFAYIGNDGNLLPAPLNMSSVRFGPAERADLVIDFSKATGKTVYLVNRLEQTDGRGPSGKLLSPGTQILRFDIQDNKTAVVDNSQVPTKLRPLPPLPDAATIAAAPQRYWEFSRTNGGWAVNNRFFDVTQPMALPNAGAWEVWTIRSTGNWHHPVHIHFEEGRILSRNGAPPPPHEAGRKDVYVIASGEEIRILLRFRDFNGKYMMHCHNLMHEDHAMMVRFDIIGNPIIGPTIEPV